MKRSLATSAVALGATIVLGLGSGAAFAGPPAGHGHASGGHGHGHASGDHGHASGNHGPAGKVSHAVRQLLKQAEVRDAALERVVSPRRLAHIDPDLTAALLGHVTAERAALADLVSSFQSGDVDLRAGLAQVRAVRPEVYARAVSELRQADRTADRIAANDTALEAAAPADVTDLTAANEAAAVSLSDALVLVDALTSASTRTDLRAAHHAVVAAVKAAHQVADGIEELAPVESTDPVTAPIAPTEPADPADPADPTDPTVPVQS